MLSCFSSPSSRIDSWRTVSFGALVERTPMEIRTQFDDFQRSMTSFLAEQRSMKQMAEEILLSLTRLEQKRNLPPQLPTTPVRPQLQPVSPSSNPPPAENIPPPALPPTSFGNQPSKRPRLPIPSPEDNLASIPPPPLSTPPDISSPSAISVLLIGPIRLGEYEWIPVDKLPLESPPNQCSEGSITAGLHQSQLSEKKSDEPPFFAPSVDVLATEISHNIEMILPSHIQSESPNIKLHAVDGDTNTQAVRGKSVLDLTDERPLFPELPDEIHRELICADFQYDFMGLCLGDEIPAEPPPIASPMAVPPSSLPAATESFVVADMIESAQNGCHGLSILQSGPCLHRFSAPIYAAPSPYLAVSLEETPTRLPKLEDPVISRLHDDIRKIYIRQPGEDGKLPPLDDPIVVDPFDPGPVASILLLADNPVINLHDLDGDTSAATIRLTDTIKGNPMLFLIDGSSTHIFLRVRVATHLELDSEPTGKPHVLISNGETLFSMGRGQLLPLILAGATLSMDCYILDGSGANSVLCAQGIKTLDPTLFVYQRMYLSFGYKGQPILLHGLQEAKPTEICFGNLRRAESTNPIDFTIDYMPGAVLFQLPEGPWHASHDLSYPILGLLAAPFDSYQQHGSSLQLLIEFAAASGDQSLYDAPLGLLFSNGLNQPHLLIPWQHQKQAGWEVLKEFQMSFPSFDLEDKVNPEG